MSSTCSHPSSCRAGNALHLALNQALQLPWAECASSPGDDLAGSPFTFAFLRLWRPVPNTLGRLPEFVILWLHKSYCWGMRNVSLHWICASFVHFRELLHSACALWLAMCSRSPQFSSHASCVRLAFRSLELGGYGCHSDGTGLYRWVFNP